MNVPRISEGRHPAHAITWQLSEVGKDNTPCIAVEFEIKDGDAKGERISWNGWLTERALDFTIKALRTCGWQGDDVEHIEALGRDVILVIEWEEYQGERQAKVKFINDPNWSGLGKKMGGDRAGRIAARVKNKLAGIENEPTDDDIPF